MAKPVTAPWATDATYPADAAPEAGTATKAAYTLGQATVGWRPKGRPPAREFNMWMNRVGAWTTYLDAGVWQDNLEVTGNILADGNVTIAAGKKLIPAGGVSQAISVDGGIIAGDAVANPSSVTAQGGNLIARASNASAEDNGKVYFGGWERQPLATMLAQDPTASHTLSYSQIIFGAGANPARVPIIGIPVGAVIIGFKVWFKKGTSNVSEINFDIVSSTNGAADHYEGVNVSNAGNGIGDTSGEVNDQAVLVAPGVQYYLRVDPSGSVAPAADRYYAAEIIWSHPDP